VYLYRHRRREALDGSGAERENGVRFSCPLARINSAKFLDPLTPGIASLEINSDSSYSPRTIRLGPIYQVPAWQRLPDIIAGYKQRQSLRHSKLDEMPVFVDMGPLSFTNLQTDVEIADVKEKAVRNALALGAEPVLWS
jgi:sterol 3beta-glucosyltransferase